MIFAPACPSATAVALPMPALAPGPRPALPDNGVLIESPHLYFLWTIHDGVVAHSVDSEHVATRRRIAGHRPRIVPTSARGSRLGHLPRSTAWKKSAR